MRNATRLPPTYLKPICKLLAGLLLTSTAAVEAQSPFRIQDLYEPELAPFYQGVASGDPVPDGFTLWTRVTPKPTGNIAQQRPVPVKWTVATDPN